MKSLHRKLLSILCAAALTVSLVPTVLAAAPACRDSGTTDVSKLSKRGIIQLLQDNPLSLSDRLYDAEPSASAPYAAGRLSDAALQSAVNRLNALRRIAGLPSVALDDRLCQSGQHGAVLLAATKQLTHYPVKPADMDEAFYKAGADSAKSSNLALGYPLIGAVDGWMDDSDPGNIDRLGHRRWQLHPFMGKVGFGYAGGYSAEQVFDTSGKPSDYEFISWPASGNFPGELFQSSQAWSVSLNPRLFQTPVKNQITVTLTQERDGKSWTFRGGQSYSTDRSAPYFNVDDQGFGISNCVIFRPDGISLYDGLYTVTIDGLRSKGGSPVSFAYQVDFFSTEAPDLPVGPEKPTDPTIPDVGSGQDGIMTTPNRTFSPGLAVKTDGSLWGWGNDLSGFGKTWGGSAVQLSGGYSSVFGSPDECFLLKDDGTLWYYGGLLPHLGVLPEPAAPVQVLDNVAQFEGGIALKKDGSVWSMTPLSLDDYETSGYGLFYPIFSGGVRQISGWAMDGGFGMALKEDGTLYSWGTDNQDGSLGRDTGSARWVQPGKVLDNVAYVAGTMAIRTDGSLWSWGSNYFGGVGNGGASDQFTPVKVLDHVTGAWWGSSGMMTTKYALTKDGSLYSWGYNSCGQLGYTGGSQSMQSAFTGGVSYQDVPRRVNIDQAVSVSANSATLLVLKQDGTLWGMGGNTARECGQEGPEFLDHFVQLLTGVRVPGKPAPQTTAFVDVKPGQWFKPFVDKAVAANLMSGMGEGKFGPDENLTVAQALVLAYQIHSQTNDGTLPQVSGPWYMPYYRYCLDKGIVTSAQVKEADLNRTATRFDMVSILDRAIPASRMEPIKTVPDGSIPDLQETDPYGALVYQWYRAGVVSGDTQGRFNGPSSISRAEVAVILCQINRLV